MKVDENRFDGFPLLLDDIPDKPQLQERHLIRPEFFYYLIYKPSFCNFLESRKKKKKLFLFYPLTLNFICLLKKNNIF